MAHAVDKGLLLKKLPRIVYEKSEDAAKDRLEQMSLAGTLLTLAQIDHDREYEICRTVAEHLLGRNPEPEETDSGEV